MGQRPQCAADDDRDRRLPEAEAEDRYAEDAHEDRRELEVRRQPRPEQIDRFAVTLLERDVLDPARLDGGDPLPVLALPNRYVLLYFLDRLHRRFPSLRTPPEIRPKFKRQLGFRRCLICSSAARAFLARWRPATSASRTG